MPDPQIGYRSVYMRGGTSRALIFHRDDLPPLGPEGSRAPWDAVFTAALGSPDSGMRQLDGMGGGISSLSKVAVVGAPSRSDADVDYTFAQVGVDSPTVGYKGNCGNISSAIGPYAVDEGLVATDGEEAVVRIHNTNTGKIIRARFPLVGGKAAVKGDYVLQGVEGSGAAIRLDFLQPGGSVTGKIFPTGRLVDTLALETGDISVTLIDVANPLAVVEASALGMRGNESPSEIEGDNSLMERLRDLRRRAAVAMGVAKHDEEARTTVANLPLVAIVSPVEEGAALRARMISADQPHRATPLTGAMALAAASRIKGTLAEGLSHHGSADIVRLAHASGLIDLACEVEDMGLQSRVASVGVIRTARRLMEGRVFVPA